MGFIQGPRRLHHYIIALTRRHGGRHLRLLVRKGLHLFQNQRLVFLPDTSLAPGRHRTPLLLAGLDRALTFTNKIPHPLRPGNAARHRHLPWCLLLQNFPLTRQPPPTRSSAPKLCSPSSSSVVYWSCVLFLHFKQARRHITPCLVLTDHG